MPTSTFVRGNLLSVVRTDAHSVKRKGFQPGDTVRVGGRKKGGWLRVRCSRTGDLVWIRSGRHLCLASEASRPASQIDLMICENQVENAQKLVEDTKESLDKWKDAFYEQVERRKEREEFIKNMSGEFDIARAQFATTQKDLEDKLQKRDTEIRNLSVSHIEVMRQRSQFEEELIEAYKKLEGEKGAHKATQNRLDLARQAADDAFGQIADLRRQIAELREQRVVVSGESVGEHREMQQAEDEANSWC